MEENLQFSALIKGTPLIRFTKAEYLDSFRKHGKIYMNSMKYYRDQAEGKGDSFIGDAYEGKVVVNNFNCYIPSKNYAAHIDKHIFSTLLIDKEIGGREIRRKKPKETVNDHGKWRNRAVCECKEVQNNNMSAWGGCQPLRALFGY